MATTPTGLPAWTRTATAATYGGDTGKRDLGGIGKVNAKTDVGAADWLRLCSDCARAVRTAPLFWARITIAYSSAPSVTTMTVQPMWGDAETYAGTPSGDYVPTVTVSGTSLVLAFPDCTETVDSVNWLVVPDEFGVSGSCQMMAATVTSPGGIDTATISSNGTVLTIPGCTTDGDVISLVVF